MHIWKEDKNTKQVKTNPVLQKNIAHIRNNREDGHPIEDFLPGPDAVGLGCHRASELSGELPGVHSDLDDVVEKCQQGCQRKGGNKQRDETKLDHWDNEMREVREGQQYRNSTICRISEDTVSIYLD